jgi:hypothetical protein
LWCRPVIPVLGQLRPEDHEFKTHLGYIGSWRQAWARLHLKKKKKKAEKNTFGKKTKI